MDSNGALQYAADYDPYGGLPEQYGTAQSSFGFTGEQNDAIAAQIAPDVSRTLTLIQRNRDAMYRPGTQSSRLKNNWIARKFSKRPMICGTRTGEVGGYESTRRTHRPTA